MKSNKEIEPVEVFSGKIMDAGIIKSLLENAEIEAFLRDEFTGTIAPWHTSAGGSGSVRVVVSNLDVDKARLIAADYEKSLS